MNRRAANLGGSFSIESQTGKGTTAFLNIPVGRKSSVEKAQGV
jgi:signal transduction histidine kinase